MLRCKAVLIDAASAAQAPADTGRVCESGLSQWPEHAWILLQRQGCPQTGDFTCCAITSKAANLLSEASQPPARTDRQKGNRRQSCCPTETSCQRYGHTCCTSRASQLPESHWSCRHSDSTFAAADNASACHRCHGTDEWQTIGYTDASSAESQPAANLATSPTEQCYEGIWKDCPAANPIDFVAASTRTITIQWRCPSRLNASVHEHQPATFVSEVMSPSTGCCTPLHSSATVVPAIPRILHEIVHLYDRGRWLDEALVDHLLRSSTIFSALIERASIAQLHDVTRCRSCSCRGRLLNRGATSGKQTSYQRILDVRTRLSNQAVTLWSKLSSSSLTEEPRVATRTAPAVVPDHKGSCVSCAQLQLAVSCPCSTRIHAPLLPHAIVPSTPLRYVRLQYSAFTTSCTVRQDGAGP